MNCESMISVDWFCFYKLDPGLSLPTYTCTSYPHSQSTISHVISYLHYLCLLHTESQKEVFHRD